MSHDLQPIKMNHERLKILQKQVDPEYFKIKIHKTKELNFNNVLNQNKKKSAFVVHIFRTPFVNSFGDFLGVGFDKKKSY